MSALDVSTGGDRHARSTALEPASPWVELVATEADWDAADPDLLTTMLGQLVLIRAFEEYVLELAGGRPDPRPGALQHRPGGRRGRLGRWR